MFKKYKLNSLQKNLWEIWNLFCRLYESHLGVSNEMEIKSATGFVLKQGAMSSTKRSPWQPVCSATRRLMNTGSFCIAHGERADPLNSIVRWIKSEILKRKKI